ncbi:MAG: 4-hydroxybenzoate octaprenyltransferase [Thiolinea sp.]
MSSLTQLRHYGRLIRIERPIGSYLLLWPTLWALWIASEGLPDWHILAIFVAGVFIMRSAGCAINDIADRKVDGEVERTKDRPLPSGDITLKEALAVFFVLLLVAFILVLQLNQLTILFSLVGALLAASYPFMKRFHHLPQVYLGAAFAWSIPMAFTAVTGELPPPVAWLLFTANLIWTTGYDTMYGMCDREDDVKIGVKSTAILLGNNDRLIVGVTQVFTLLTLLGAGFMAGLSGWFWLGLLAASGFFIYQQYLIRDRDRWLSLRAFLNNNWAGMMIFLGIAADYTLR